MDSYTNSYNYRVITMRQTTFFHSNSSTAQLNTAKPKTEIKE